jgi:hypothetical protein
MMYRLLADIVVVIHLLFIPFAVFGGLLGLWRARLLLLHLPAAVWVTALEFKGLICPLTPLENYLRAAGGERGYSGGFIEHYIVPVLYPPGLTPQMQTMLGVIALAINIAVYALVLWRLRARRLIQ